MVALIYNSPRGTYDYYGENIKYIDFINKSSRDLFKLYNYREMITPHFEHTEVFSRGIGENSDIVKKEMFTFEDKKNRSLTLRPEGTASIVRAVIERKLFGENLPLKYFYIGSMFRYERPQKGRMREFTQVGVEAIGSDNPAIDAEVIWLLGNLFKNLGFKNLELSINSIGCTECRKDYTLLLESYLNSKIDELCSDCAGRIGKNTLRVFDCKVKECQSILKDAPKISGHLCGKCKSHLEDVFEILRILDIKYVHNENLVRGFDYYTRTIFEIVSHDIDSAQNALGGGGRYDNLISEFGGPKLSSIGFAVGLERTMLLMQDLGIKPPEDKTDILSAYIINMSLKFNSYLFEIFKFLRQNKVICDSNFNIRNVGTEIKWAKEQGYSHIIIIGEDEVKSSSLTIKDLNNYSQVQISWLNEKIKLLNLFKVPNHKN